jgi:hypothetical protein
MCLVINMVTIRGDWRKLPGWPASCGSSSGLAPHFHVGLLLDQQESIFAFKWTAAPLLCTLITSWQHLDIIYSCRLLYHGVFQRRITVLTIVLQLELKFTTGAISWKLSSFLSKPHPYQQFLGQWLSACRRRRLQTGPLVPLLVSSQPSSHMLRSK